MSYKTLTALALVWSAPVLAQPPAEVQSPPPAVAAVPQLPPVEPARLAAAERVIELVYPAGALQQAWNMSPMMQTIMAMRIADFGLPFPAPEGIPADATIGQMVTQHDPHFAERMRISSQVIAEEMGRIFTMIEPDFRRVMATAYARRFTGPELEEIGRFYGTPAGRRYAGEVLTIMQDPELVRGFMMMMPRVAMQMPAVAQRVTAATAHLPALTGPRPPAPEGQRQRRPRN